MTAKPRLHARIAEGSATAAKLNPPRFKNSPLTASPLGSRRKDEIG